MSCGGWVFQPMMAGNPVHPDEGLPDRTKQTGRTAVLIFSDLPALDLARRRWPSSAGALIRLPDAAGLRRRGLDVHWYTTRGLSGWVRLPGAVIHEQAGDDFGSSLLIALRELAGSGYDRIVVVGSDCPQLTVQDVVQAAAGLEDHRMVLGPDHRGGIYLLGIRADAVDLIAGIVWRRNTDFAQLAARLPAHEIRILPEKLDLDQVVDLRLLSRRSPAFLLFRLLSLMSGRPFSAPLETPSFLRVQQPTWQLPPPRPAFVV